MSADIRNHRGYYILKVGSGYWVYAQPRPGQDLFASSLIVFKAETLRDAKGWINEMTVELFAERVPARNGQFAYWFSGPKHIFTYGHRGDRASRAYGWGRTKAEALADGYRAIQPVQGHHPTTTKGA